MAHFARTHPNSTWLPFPSVTNVSPASGNAGDDIVITLTSSDGCLSASLCGVPITNFYILNPTQIAGKAGPSPGPGIGNADVTHLSGSSGGVNLFTYLT